MTPQSHSWHISRGKDDLKGYMHPSVHCCTVYNSKDMEATEMSIDRGTDKGDAVYLYIQWNVTQSQKRMKQCHLQQYRWT